MTQSLVGNVLVASTLVTESVFARGVCLMMHHDDDGAIGVMLNRPIWPAPTELIKMLGGEIDSNSSETDQTGGSRLGKDGIGKPVPSPPAIAQTGLIHFGGPLSGPVLAIHGRVALAEAQTGSGIYVAAQKEHLEQLVKEKSGDYRLIIGHAGWGAGQLDSEIQAGIWHVLPATAEMVFGEENDLWPLLIRRATGSSLSRWVGAPDNPAKAALN
jgi:putative transcriptional regulator